jgi:hypothetical protein
MSDQGRLIFNSRGESAKATVDGDKVRVQASAFHYVDWSEGITVEVEFSKREAAAFALQVLDAAGYAAEVERRA